MGVAVTSGATPAFRHPDSLWILGLRKICCTITSIPTESFRPGRLSLESAVHLSADGADGADGRAEMTAPKPGEDVTLQVNGTPNPSS